MSRDKTKIFQKSHSKKRKPETFFESCSFWFSLLCYFIQECRGILAARCASCNCMTYFYCAPLQSCRRLYQLGD
ncbi:hypothetical protein DW957_01130 [Dorea formicigenerans]|uniref:Uncharacterized protein n=1 Tax=Dorea formicigenerans TaxID=39486 RepID=A0A413QNW9_9FIRM|nr:hypothetical protein DW957_01130 [Dorea formicigenerans]